MVHCDRCGAGFEPRREGVRRPRPSSASRPTEIGSGTEDERGPDPEEIPSSIRRRRIGRWLLCLGLVLASWLVASLGVAYHLTHRRSPPFAEPAPAVAWGTFESHRFPTRDGHEIGAWYAQGREDAPSVLLLHGHKGSRGNCLGRAELLAKHGCSVLLISLRAHGDSTGELDDIGYGPGAMSSPPSSSSNADDRVSRS